MRDIAPTGVRLPPVLRDQLMRMATINGRSLSQEITQRLAESIDFENRSRHGGPVVLRAAEPVARGVHRTELTDMHRQLVSVFDTLAPDKQLALLTLLKR